MSVIARNVAVGASGLVTAEIGERRSELDSMTLNQLGSVDDVLCDLVQGMTYIAGCRQLSNKVQESSERADQCADSRSRTAAHHAAQRAVDLFAQPVGITTELLLLLGRPPGLTCQL